MLATRTDCFFGRLVTDVAHQHILPALCTLLCDQIRVIGNLPHLHDEAEDVGVVVKHDTSSDVSVKLARCRTHDAVRKILFLVAKEFVVNHNIFRWQFLKALSINAMLRLDREYIP